MYRLILSVWRQGRQGRVVIACSVKRKKIENKDVSVAVATLQSRDSPMRLRSGKITDLGRLNRGLEDYGEFNIRRRRVWRMEAWKLNDREIRV